MATAGSLTAEQRLALQTDVGSIAVDSGAGCGKTFVLTRRFLLHLDPERPSGAPAVSLHRLVAITFTERAAREMRQRIRDACRERWHAATPQYRDKWREIVRELDSARISTIHSFCTSLLRNHAIEAGLDPRFTVLDEAQSDLLRNEAVDRMWRAEFEAADLGILDLIVRADLAPLQEIVTAMIASTNRPHLERWARVDPTELLTVWQAFQEQQAIPFAQRQVFDSPSAAEVRDLLRNEPAPNDELHTHREALRAALDPQTGGGDPLELLRTIPELAKVDYVGRKKTWSDDSVYHRMRDAMETLRADAKTFANLLDQPPEFDAVVAPDALQCVRLAHRALQFYQAAKVRQAALDFDDLVSRTRALLRNHPKLRRRVASEIDALLVDEFQDTDALQVDLIRALCDDDVAAGKLFFVGDYKQSIYRFRGAVPQRFLELKDDVPPTGRVALTTNFRSQPAVLDFVNALFCDDLVADYRPLRAHRSQVAPTPAVEFLWATDPDVAPRAEPLRRLEADWIARRIRRMIDDGEHRVWDDRAAQSGEPAARAVRPGDVCILFRALSDVRWYESALRDHGLPYYLVGGHAFYAQQEVFDVLNLLRTVADANNLVALAGLLRSPFFSLTDESLFWLAQTPGGLATFFNLDDDLPPLPNQLTDQQATQVRSAQETIDWLRSHKDRRPVADLIHVALEQTGYDAALLAEFLGERKLANVEKLIDQARQFDRAAENPLHDFITQLAEFVAAKPNEPLAAVEAEDTDAICLMSIHKSKGLEFPVVVVADLNSQHRADYPPVVVDEHLGPLIRPSRLGYERSDRTTYNWHVQMERGHDADEINRLLYVASTRAADYLILSASFKDLDKPQGPWTKLLERRFDLQSGALKARLPDDYPTPRIEVTAAPPPIESKPSRSRDQWSLDEIREQVSELRAAGGLAPPRGVETIGPSISSSSSFSYSRIAPSGMGDYDPSSTPAELGLEEFRTTEEGAQARLGVLAHALLAAWPLGSSDDLEDCCRSIPQRDAAWTDEEIQRASNLVRRFLASPRAAHLRDATELLTEVDFVARWPANVPVERSVLLEGYIDCLYRGADGAWRLLDYKTNQIAADEVPTVAAQYEMQLMFYAYAAEHALREPPVSLVLHFLTPSQEVEVPWDDAQRERFDRWMVERLQTISPGWQPPSLASAVAARVDANS